MAKRLWLSGLALFLLAAFVQAPAAWLGSWIDQATSQRWRLGGVEGTVWRGRATVHGLDRPTHRWRTGVPLHWRAIWSGLPRGQFAVQIDLDEGHGALLTAGLEGWAIARLDALLPVSLVAVLLPVKLGDYGWSGTVRAQGTGFGCDWARGACTGRIDLLWEQASVALIPGLVLGDYRVRITGEGEALRFDLATVRGPLQIAGAGELSAAAMRFNGEAHAEGDSAARLDVVLRALGRPAAAPGRYLIEYREMRK